MVSDAYSYYNFGEKKNQDIYVSDTLIDELVSLDDAFLLLQAAAAAPSESKAAAPGANFIGDGCAADEFGVTGADARPVGVGDASDAHTNTLSCCFCSCCCCGLTSGRQ